MKIKPPLTFDDQEYFHTLQQRKTFLNHIHLDGSIPAASLFDWYQHKGIPLLLPEKDIHGNPIQKRDITSVEELEAFQQGLLTKYDLVSVFQIPVTAMQTADDLKAMAIAHCYYLQSQNTVYAETRFAPWYHSHKNEFGQSTLDLEEVIGTVLEGFEEGKKRTGVIVKPIISINREIDPEKAKDIVRAALAFQYYGVVGIDLACDEVHFPPEWFKAAYRLTFDSNLKRTVHAGEMCSLEQNVMNMYTAVVDLKADALGQGIHLYQSKFCGNSLWGGLMTAMRILKIRLESNPISNYNFFIDDIAELHLDKLLEEEILVTINPDDPAMWPNGDMTHNLYVLGKMYGDTFVDKVIENSITTAWGLSEEEKEKYLKLY